jgi:hypothetical protein
MINLAKWHCHSAGASLADAAGPGGESLTGHSSKAWVEPT